MIEPRLRAVVIGVGFAAVAVTHALRDVGPEVELLERTDSFTECVRPLGRTPTRSCDRRLRMLD